MIYKRFVKHVAKIFNISLGIVFQKTGSIETTLNITVV